MVCPLRCHHMLNYFYNKGKKQKEGYSILCSQNLVNLDSMTLITHYHTFPIQILSENNCYVDTLLFPIASATITFLLISPSSEQTSYFLSPTSKMYNKPQPETHLNSQHLPEAACLQDSRLSLHETCCAVPFMGPRSCYSFQLEVLHQVVDAIGALPKSPIALSECQLLTALN